MGGGVESKVQCCREFYTWDNISELSWVGKSARTLSPPPLPPLTYSPTSTHTLNWSLNEGNPSMDWDIALSKVALFIQVILQRGLTVEGCLPMACPAAWVVNPLFLKGDQEAVW